MFSGPHQWMQVGLDSRKVVFCDVFMFRTSWSGDVHSVAAGFWGSQPPFFAIPSFAFKYTFQAELLMSLWAVPYDVIRAPYTWSSSFSSFDIIQPPWQSRHDILNGLICSYCSDWCFYIFISWRLHLSFSFLLCTGIFLNLIISDGHTSSGESVVVLSAYMRETNSLASGNMHQVWFHWLWLSLVVEGPWPLPMLF